MPTPPSYQKVNPAGSRFSILRRAHPHCFCQIDQAAQTLLAQRISMVNGVAQVQVLVHRNTPSGQLNPHQLRADHRWFERVELGNVNWPTGTLYGADKAHTIQATGQLMNAAMSR
jgi:HAE1 family hydrophobic/amphiphilic exporter-1